MTLTWLNHLFTTLVGRLLFLLTLWLLSYAWRAWKQFLNWERRYQRFLERQRRAQQRAQHALPGLPRPPACSACQAEPTQPALRVPMPPPVWTKSSPRGRHRHIRPTWQACPFEACAYYGWPGLGNWTANGHPNHRRPRQWLCQACHGFFIETRGTVFYRRREAPEFVRQVLTSVAEGLNVEATARLHRIQVETVETWFALATTHFEQLATYLYHNLRVEQVELDDLFVRLRAVQSATGSPRRCAWLYNAFDPVSKFWLAFSLGDRSLSTVQHLVHRLVGLLPPGCVPAFLTDGEASFEAAILAHFGHWLAVTPPDQPQASPRRRWLPLPNLHYAQVVKHRRGRRLLYVTPRLVFGQLDQLLSTLTSHGWALSTALIERFNLTPRRGQHVPALGRRTLALVQSDLTLYRQLVLAQAYINFCLPHAALTLPNQTACRSSVTPAMTLGLTDRVWSLEEMLLWRVPPTRPTTLATGG